MTPSELPAQWREYAATNREVLTREALGAIERCAKELEESWAAYWNEELALSPASEESGYDENSLGRMLRELRVTNVGTKHRPRIRRKDLPRKPGAAMPTAPVGEVASFDQFTTRALARGGAS